MIITSRTSSKTLRGQLCQIKDGVLAYNLPHLIRKFYIWGEEVKRSMDWLSKRLIKVSARKDPTQLL